MKHPLATVLLLLAARGFAADLPAAASAEPNASPLTAARALFDAKKFPEAQAAFEKISLAEATCADAHYFLARLALRRGDTDQAITCAEKAVALAPDNADYQHTLGDAYGSAAQKASLLHQPGLAKKCLAAFQRAVELAPDNADFHQSLLDFYRQAPPLVGGGMDKALTEAAALKRLDAQRGRTAFASLYAGDKKFDAAVAEFGDDHAAGNFFVSQFALRRDDTERAVEFGEKTVTLAPGNAAYQAGLGDAYGRSAQKAGVMSFRTPGLAKKCLAAYQRAAALAPDNVDYHQKLFEFYREAPGFLGGGADKALAEAATIKRLDPMRGRIAFVNFYAADKKYDRALAELDDALRTTPDDYVALYHVGRLAAMSGQFLDRGAAALRRCLEFTPSAPNSPSHAAAQWRLGNILEKKNELAAARSAYEAALKLDPNFKAAADALKKLK
jgi:tetratricopeptide (TPR) repeat protein